MRKRRDAFSSSTCFPVHSASTAGLIVPRSQSFVTVVLTRTSYTTYIYSNSHSSSESPSTSTFPSTASLPSPYASVQYEPTTLSITETTRSTETIKTTVYATSTRTVSADSNPQATSSASGSGKCRTSCPTTTSAPATTASSAVAAGQAGQSSPQMVSSPDASKRAAVIAGSMTASLGCVLLILLLFIFFFRRRKRRQLVYLAEKRGDSSEQPRMSSSSQALPFDVAAVAGTGRRYPSIVPRRPVPAAAEDKVVENRLSGFDFLAPYIRRDSRLGPPQSSPLRLMNPDPSPTPTPDPPPIIFNPSASTSSAGTTAALTTRGSTPPNTFLQRQRTALATALLQVKRSFSSQDAAVATTSTAQSRPQSAGSDASHLRPSPLHIPPRAPPPHKPTLTMPSEVILAGGGAGAAGFDHRPVSAHSAMSNGTIIHNRGLPYDPFVTAFAPPTGKPTWLNYSNGHGDGIARRDFLAPPALLPQRQQQQQQQRFRIKKVPSFQQQRQHQQRPFSSPSPTPQPHYGAGSVSPLARSYSVSPTRSEVSSIISLRSGPFDLASASVVELERQQGTANITDVVGCRRQREQTPNWEVHRTP